MSFELVSDYAPAGDQPQPIEKLTAEILSGVKHQMLLGVNGSGIKRAIANTIENEFCCKWLEPLSDLALKSVRFVHKLAQLDD